MKYYLLVTFMLFPLTFYQGGKEWRHNDRAPASITSCTQLAASFFGSGKRAKSVLEGLSNSSQLSYKDQDWLAVYLSKREDPTSSRIIKMLDHGSPLGAFERDWLHYQLSRQFPGKLASVKKKIQSFWDVIRVPKSIRDFDSDAYFKAREGFLAQLDRGEEILLPQSWEKKLAYLDALNFKNIIYSDYKTSYWSLLKRKRALYGILKGLDLKEGLSLQKMNKLIGKLYLLSNQGPQKWSTLLLKNKEERLALVFSHLIQQELIRSGLERTLKQRGLLSSSRWRSGLNKLFESRSFKLASTIFLNAHLIEAPIPVYLPKLVIYIPPKTLQKIILAGENGNAQKVFWKEVMVKIIAGEDKLLASVVKSADRKSIYNSLRKPLMGLGAIGLTWYLIQEVRSENIKEGRRVIEDVNQAVEDSVDAIEELIPKSSGAYVDELMNEYITTQEQEFGRSLSSEELQQIYQLFEDPK
ncbi:MAG: hypothetical protein HOM21_01640 [Halobacteriovoraceae bacterium]|nr:hypothetical protein [Halobacteriovoraceae bacterium]